MNRSSLKPASHRANAALRAGLTLAALVSHQTHATDGYFSHGYGIKAKGRAGVALTATDDAFGGANNPATVALEQDRIDVGIDWFRPDRRAERSGPAAPLNGSVTSDRKDFFIPEIGYRKALNADWAVGFTLYGNGGMNTDYPAGQLNLGPGANNRNLLAGQGHLGLSLSQAFVAPSLAWRIAPKHSIGIAPILAYQRFKAYGLDAFTPFSQAASALTNQGTDDAWGAGARIGYLWNVSSSVSLGAAYSSRVYSTGFDRYRGLFADNGSFDTPQTVGAGVGWQVLPEVRLAVDYKWIDYRQIQAVGNPSANPGALGQSGGPGFGWSSIHVVKFGTDWKLNDAWTVRAGYGYSGNPIAPRDVTFNILAPGVVQHHLTAGVTYTRGQHEISAAYLHAFENSVTGPSFFTAIGVAPAGTRETISMSQESLALQYSYRF
jgi:long-chain fatty acid transport protein